MTKTTKTRTGSYLIRRAHLDLEDVRVEAEVSRPDPEGFFRWTLVVDGAVWTEDVDADRARGDLLLLGARGISRRTLRRCWAALVARTR